MPTPIINAGVMGTDGVAVVQNTEGRWSIWEKSEIYDGTVGRNRYVPKINDWVVDAVNAEFFRVVSVDPVTLIATLEVIRPAGVSYVLTAMDVLLGGNRKSTETYRVFIDKTTLPYTVTIDKRNKIYGSEVTGYKLFRGTDISETGRVVSERFDGQGNFISNLIDMELVAFNTHDNYAVKSPRSCRTRIDLPDNEVLTAVFYNATGGVVSTQQLLVINSSFVPLEFDGEKYITRISLDSNFIDTGNDRTVHFPLNVPVSGLNLFGIVHYSDGSQLKLPIDGTKFSVLGIDQYLSTIVGQRLDLVLSYHLSPGEKTYAATSGDGKFITESYSLVTDEANYSYTVKLYVYPEWLDVNQGYRLRWFMTNLDRNVIYDVTPYVQFADNTGVFDPRGYGTVQRKAVMLLLSDVSGQFRDFIHTQQVDILLRGNPVIMNNVWEVSHEATGQYGLYGRDLFAKRNATNVTRFKIDSQIVLFEDWLEKMYYVNHPIQKPDVEINPPVPTHFEVVYNNQTMRFNISEWNNELSVNISLTLFSNLYVRFIKETPGGDLILAVAGLIIR